MNRLDRTTFILGFFLFMTAGLLVSCGRAKTEKLLMNKRWVVYDVTPPKGVFNIEKSNRAQDLKNGFYKNAWFEFLPDSLFVASFGGKTDTGKYVIRMDGETVSLYPRYGHTIYEQIEIEQLSEDRLHFNTKVADFHMTLHLKSLPLKE